MVLATRKLGWTNVDVSAVCLGTMTFGIQCNEAESHAIIDAYVERGGNFFDTAEMYPAPASDPRWKPGASEEILGSWLAKNKDIRSKLIVATKVSGFNPNSDTAGNRKLTLGTGGERLENGMPKPMAARLDRASILESCEASLKRLQTDYIDILQVHWPDRYVPLFGGLNYNPGKERPGSIPIKESVAAMKELIDAGKIKYYGLSNETTFGLCQWVREADALGCPRPVSVQQMFCLLVRTFESEMAEACAPSNYNVALLPWSPLASGVLSDKYIGSDGKMLPSDKFPEKSRLALYPKWMVRYKEERVATAVEQYAKISKEAGMPLAKMALRWCLSRWFATSTIIGATTIEQLNENMDAFEVEGDEAPLPDDLIDKIDQVHMHNMNCALTVERIPHKFDQIVPQ